jgi:hypothetical protein
VSTAVVRRRPRERVQFAAACSVLAAVFAGCGPGGPDRAVVGGLVTYRGKAVPEGIISFVPTDGTSGPTMTASISQGQYKADKWGGVPAGTYRVEIVAAHGRSTGEKEDAGFRLVQYIPAKYNAKSQLKTTIEAGGGSITRDFALTD